MLPRLNSVHPRGSAATHAEKAGGWESGDDAPRRRAYADHPYAAAARPGVAEPRLVPEEVARLRTLGAEAQDASPAVDDHRSAAGVPLERAGILDRALVRHHVVRARQARHVPRQLAHGAMAGDEPEADRHRRERRDHGHGDDRDDQ